MRRLSVDRRVGAVAAVVVAVVAVVVTAVIFGVYAAAKLERKFTGFT